MLSLFGNLSIARRDASHGSLWHSTLTPVSPSLWPVCVALGHFQIMALLDLYQLAVLYNLRHCDAEFPSQHSHPPMSTNPRAHSSLPLSTLPVPTTPRHRRVPATVVGLTPLSLGSSIRKRQEGDTDRVDKYDREDYEDYIREDLSCRVFVDFEVFMKRVLHVPDDWETRWGPAIDAVKASTRFNKHHKDYCELCEESGTLEKNFYPALMETANAVLDVV